MSKIIPVINQIIKDKRKEKKITQEEFTKIINKSIATVRRYDTGDLISENTLILICNKLNLDLELLLEMQDKENEISGDKFYIDLINKSKTKADRENKISLNDLKINTIISHLKPIYTLLSNPDGIIEVTFKNNKYYITEFPYEEERRKLLNEVIHNQHFKKLINREKTLDILTQEQAKNLIKDLQEYFEFKIEKIRKEKLKK